MEETGINETDSQIVMLVNKNLIDGIQKVFQGITDLEEILQVCRYERR